MFAKTFSATKNFRKKEQQKSPNQPYQIISDSQPYQHLALIECQALWQLNTRPLEDQNISNENMQIAIAVPVTAVNWLCVMKLKNIFKCENRGSRTFFS